VLKFVKTAVVLAMSATAGPVAAAIPGLPKATEAQASLAEVIAYDMPGVKGYPVKATAMLFLPKGPAPAGGYNLIAYAHGTSGQAAFCAPTESLKRGGPWESVHDQNGDYIAWLLQNGFAVVAPDLEGMGPPGVVPSYGHPYYNRSSEGKSMVWAVMAAKAELGDRLSGAWAADGLSEGGFAALSAASEAGAATGVGMNFLGAAAVAPVLRVPEIYRTTWGQINRSNQTSQSEDDIGPVVFMNAEIAYLYKSAHLAGYTIKAAELFRSRMLERLKDDKCLDQDNQEIDSEILASQKAGGKLIDWPGTYGAGRLPFELVWFMTDNQGYFEAHKLPGKILFVQGDADDTTPIRIGRDAAAGIRRAGTDLQYVELKNVGHYAAPMAGRDAILAFYRQLFSSNSAP